MQKLNKHICKPKADCQVPSGKTIVAEENRKKYVLENMTGKNVNKYAIEKCLMKEVEQQKCNYLFEVEHNRLIFIELKGTHIDTAVNQILSTILFVKQNYSIEVKVINARIVFSGSTSDTVFNPEKRRYKKFVTNKLLVNGNLEIVRGNLTETC